MRKIPQSRNLRKPQPPQLRLLTYQRHRQVCIPMITQMARETGLREIRGNVTKYYGVLLPKRLSIEHMCKISKMLNGFLKTQRKKVSTQRGLADLATI